MLTDEQDPSATGGIDRQPLPCGCAPFTPIRCDEALRLWSDQYLPAHRAAQTTYAAWATDINLTTRAAHKEAKLREIDAWNAYAEHLGADYEIQSREHALIVLHNMETELLLGRMAAC